MEEGDDNNKGGGEEQLQEDEEEELLSSVGRLRRRASLLPLRFLPIELQLKVIACLPSPLLFKCRVLSRAVHALSLRVLSCRPFLALQASPACCYLLPLDTPSTPLPCTITIAKPSFEIVFASSNLLCLRRRYCYMLDICVCNIFRKRKTVLPPIVHPDLAPRILRRVFLEDRNVESLDIIAFHAGMHAQGSQTSGDSSCNGSNAGNLCRENLCQMSGDDQFDGDMFRIFVGNAEYMLIFDSHTNQWSDPICFSPELKRPQQTFSVLSGRYCRNGPPLGRINPDGRLVLFSPEATAVFDPKDVAFHFLAVKRRWCDLEVADHPAEAYVASSSLRVRLLEAYSIHESESSQSVKHEMAIHVKQLFPPPQCGCGIQIIHSSCHGYKNMVIGVELNRNGPHTRLDLEADIEMEENWMHGTQPTESFSTGSSAMEERRMSMSLPPTGQPSPMQIPLDSNASPGHPDLCPLGPKITTHMLTIHMARIDNTNADIKKWSMDATTVDASALLPPSDVANNLHMVKFFLLGGLHDTGGYSLGPMFP